MKIVFLEPLGLQVSQIEKACEGLKKAGHEVLVFPDRNENLDVLKQRAEGADVVVESNIPLRKDFIEACPNLKMLSIAFTGLDHIDLDACRQRGITVMNAAGYSTEAVAELAIAMMIDLYRKVRENDIITRACQRKGIMPGREIGGKTVGIIGMGNIGQRVAEIAKVFGCKVLAWNRTPKSVAGVTFVDKETLLKESDIVTLHIALNAETRDFIGEKDFALMKPSAILVNTARGPVVNEQALAKALKNGTIAGAATDVYGTEPPLKQDNPLFDAPNLLMLPHIGFATEEAFVLRLGIVVDNVEKWLAQ
ncbi:MAG: hydroxyacid dehydrogenase [Bacteroidales bacterium]|nr:hydroxyacid dehydrogenase [Bacteroidales bacterium]